VLLVGGHSDATGNSIFLYEKHTFILDRRMWGTFLPIHLTKRYNNQTASNFIFDIAIRYVDDDDTLLGGNS